MQVVFVSNYFNHHQLSFCDALYELLEGSFCFLQTQPMEEERIRMGWQAEERPYVRYVQPDGTTTGGPEAFMGRNPDEETAGHEWRHLLLTADVVIFGGCDDESYIRERLAAGKPIFRYNERLYKEGQWKAISPRGLLQKYKDHTRYRKAPVYFLCAGAYVPCDLGIIHAYPEKMLRFGYFPETREYAQGEPFSHKKKGSILWAARMIDWKHPELVVKTAAYLKEHLKDHQEEIPFHITMIGGGELEEEVHSLAEELGVTDKITFAGFRGPEEVRAAMEESEIYLVTSDRKEGWGAVVNEAMNSGCAVVADHMIGAAPWMIRQRENGILYRDGCEQQLQEYVAELLQDPAECRRLGEAAQQTVRTEWNARTAAERLVRLCREMRLLTGGPDTGPATGTENGPEPGDAPGTGPAEPALCADGQCLPAPSVPALWTDGPCSPAPVIPERRMYRYLTERNEEDRT